jgi:hypothetical protein
LLRRLNSKDDLSNSVKKTSRTTQEDEAGPPVHAGLLGTKYAGSGAESEEALMQTDLLLTWGVLFGTILLFAYSTTRR